MNDDERFDQVYLTFIFIGLPVILFLFGALPLILASQFPLLAISLASFSLFCGINLLLYSTHMKRKHGGAHLIEVTSSFAMSCSILFYLSLILLCLSVVVLSFLIVPRVSL